MAEYKEEPMDAFAAQCLDLYDCGSSIDSTDSNDIVIWSLTGPPTADYKLMTDQDSKRYEARLLNHMHSPDDDVESKTTPMSELLKNNLDLAPVHVKQTGNTAPATMQIKQEAIVKLSPSKEKEAISKGGIAGKFMDWLERKVITRSQSFVKNINLLWETK